MKKGLMENMVPVSVHESNDIWFIDVSNLSLSELINLKKELIGYSIQSIRVLDAIIHENAGTTYEETNFTKRDTEQLKKGCRNPKAFTKRRRNTR